MRTKAEQKIYDDYKLTLKVGYCPFHDNDKIKFLREWRYFYLTKNKYPRSGLKEAFLIIPYRHTNLLNDQEQTELTLIGNELDNEDYFVYENIEGLKSVYCKHFHAVKL